MDIRQELEKAIKNRKPIEFEYSGNVEGMRVGNPHILYMKKNMDGTVPIYVDIWQVGGVSDSGELPNWRQFKFDKIIYVKILDNEPSFEVAEKYNEESGRYQVVLEKVMA
ncbi:MAG: BNR repeat-containing protein [Clostridiales bacterium]|nr:BNR repeat-containing protein [Clostridiales bacterium]